MTTATRTPNVERLYGSGDIEAFFAGNDRVILPWPEAPRRRGEPRVDPAVAEAVLAGPPRVVDVDPRILHATQPWVLAHHARYYLTGEWERTGSPSADHHRAFNRYPLVVNRNGKAVLLGGHHRALAALIEGRSLRAQVLRAAVDQPVAVTPSLLVGNDRPPAFLPHAFFCSTPEMAAAFIRRGRSAVVPVPGVAGGTLELLGLPVGLRLERLRAAGLLAANPEDAG